MNRSLNPRSVADISRRLAELLGLPPSQAKAKPGSSAPASDGSRADLLVSAGGFKFAVSWKASGHAAPVTMAIRSLRPFVEKSRGMIIPLVATNYLGEVGRQLCAEAGVCWLDLSGNAHLTGPGLRVSVEGKPNRFKRPGRPRSVFAPKSSRIARWFLMAPERAFTQRELARTSGLDEGFTSRIVHQLEAQRLVVRNVDGAVKVADYNALLEAWREVYDFSKHHIVRGHVAARSSDEVLRRMSEHLKREKLEHAVTGLAGAWLLNQFAGFRLVVFYVTQILSAEATQAMGFHEEERGENVWLVVPNDEGVFQGTADRNGIRCVHPLQVYLDLKDHPERAAEAAAQLRQKLLRKGNHA